MHQYGIRPRGLEFEADALIKNNCSPLQYHVCGLGEPAREGECWGISELPIDLSFWVELTQYGIKARGLEFESW
jgi:hypothetical protein